MGPGVVERFDETVDHHAPLMFDAEGIAAGDPADFARRHVILSRNCENSGKVCARNRDNGAGAAFAEEGMFGGHRVGDIYGCAEEGKSRSLTPRRTRGFGMTVGWLVAE